MNRYDISRRVHAIADRFGADNPQEFRLLSSQLARAEPDEVVAGLLLAASGGNPDQSNSDRQELAGRLLATLNPQGELDLARSLREILPAYDLSVEEIPRYLAGRCGREAVLSELRLIESTCLDTRTAASAKTMRWWLRDVAP